MSRTKKILLNSIVIFFSIIFGFIIFLLIDFSINFIKTPRLNSCGEPKDGGFYELKKKCNGKLRFYTNIFDIKTDEFGFRINENYEVKNEKKKMIFLGDSFTFGINGYWDEIFVGIFEEKSNMSVVNAGFSSYSPTVYNYQYDKALKSKILSDVHTVVIAIDISDVQDESGYWTDGPNHPVKMKYAQAFSPSPIEQKRFLNKIIKIIGQNLAYTKKIYKYIQKIILNKENLTPKYKVENLSRSAFTHTEWSNLEKDNAAPYDLGYLPLGVKGGLVRLELNITKIVKKAKLSGSDTYFLIYPWPAQLVYNQTVFSWNEFMKNLCQKSGCKGVIDTFPSFQNSIDNEKKLNDIFWVGDVHFTKYGNQIIANELFNYFLNNDVIKISQKLKK